jgi:hypothetical protein
LRGIAAGLVAVGCALVPTTAGGHEKSWKTKVDATYEMRSPEGNAFTGELEGRKRCVKNRKITIIRSGAGPIGSVRSSQSGEFELTVPGVEDGSYFAKAKKRVRRPGDHKHKCRGGRSPVITVSGSCENAVLSGGPSAADSISVDDDLALQIDGTPIFTDDDEEAEDLPPIALGATAGGEALRATASNSTTFGGPMSLDPLWIHCPARSISFALDPAGFSSPGGDFGEVFYDRTFVIPDFVP